MALRQSSQIDAHIPAQPSRARGAPDPDGDLAGVLTVAPTQPRRGLVLVRVLGEIDMLTAPRLRDVLHGAVQTAADDRDIGADATADDEHPSVVCDLDGVTFLGASGLDVIASTQRSSAARRVQLVLVASHRTVVRPLRLTALDRRVTLTDTHPALDRRGEVR
ncbi:STAS domain-containing protein [Actinomycetospora sp. C-140]